MITSLEDEFPEALDPKWRNGLIKEFERGWEMEKAQYMARQLKARKQEFGRGTKTIDGLGQAKFAVDARTYFRWIGEDEHFWDDDGNVNRFLKDNPECKAPRPEMKARIVV